MATFFAYGVEETSTTSGTGSYALSGATPNSVTFASTVPDQSTVIYKAWDGARSEIGYGVFDYPATLRRLEILSSSNNNEVIDWQVAGQRIISLLPQDTASFIDANPAEIPCPFPEGGECGQVLAHTDGTECDDVEWIWRPYPIAAYIDGTPDANQKVRLAVTEALKFEAGFIGSWAWCDIPVFNISVVSIKVNRVSPFLELGNLEFSTGTLEAAWFTVDDETKYLVPGDRIEFLFPADVDTIEDVSITARALIMCRDAAVRFLGGGFSGDQLEGENTSSLLQFALPTAPESADTILIAGWMGYADGTRGKNLVLVYDNTADHFIAVTIGDGNLVAIGSFAFALILYDSSGSEVVSGYTEIAVDLEDGWHSFAISIQASTQTMQIMVDTNIYAPGAFMVWSSANPIEGLSSPGLAGLWQFCGSFVSGTGNVPPAFTFTPPSNLDFTIYSPDMSFYTFYMNFGAAFFDLTDPDNVAKLFTLDNKVVDWGPHGQNITGGIPPCYFKGDVYTFRLNLGTSGAVANPFNWLDGGPGELSVSVQNFVPLPPGAEVVDPV